MKLVDYLQQQYNLSEKESRGLILAGKVYVNEKKIDKPGYFIREKDVVRYTQLNAYPSRAFKKLKSFIESKSIDISEKYVLDAGAAHGGFTKVLLEFNAAGVVCVDVSYGQLALNLRSHVNVYVKERISICALTKDQLPFQPDFFVADLSFISARKSLDCIRSLLRSPATGIYLFKPQFEANTEQLEKGVVKSEEQRTALLLDFIDWLEKNHWRVIAYEDSEVKGKKGNQETLFFIESKF